MSQVFKIGGLTNTERVRPGDLITAEFMNAILARLDELEDRLAKIEDGLGGTPTFHLPTYTLPTTFTMPTVTFHPTFATKITEPTFRHATVLTPSELPTRSFGTFVGTFVRPSLEVEEFDLGPYVVPADKGIFPVEAEVTALPGIGEKEKDLLNKANIKNVGEFSQMDVKVLSETLGMKMEDANALLGMANNVVIKQQFKQR